MITSKKRQSSTSDTMINNSVNFGMSARLNRKPVWSLDVDWTAVCLLVLMVLDFLAVGFLWVTLLDVMYKLVTASVVELFIKGFVDATLAVPFSWALSPSRLTSRMKHTKWYILESVREWRKTVFFLNEWHPVKTLHIVELWLVFLSTIYRISWPEICFSFPGLSITRKVTRHLCLALIPTPIRRTDFIYLAFKTYQRKNEKRKNTSDHDNISVTIILFPSLRLKVFQISASCATAVISAFLLHRLLMYLCYISTI